MARAKDGRKSFTYFLGITNILVALVWTALFLFTDWVISRDGSTSLLSPGSMMLYVLTFFFVALGGVILPSLEKSGSKSGVNMGMSFSWAAALLYAGMAASHFLHYDVQIRQIFNK